MQQAVAEIPFFHWTAQGITLISVISGFAIYVIKILRRIDRGFSVFEWQHGLMWKKYVKETTSIPPYPHTSWESFERQNEEERKPAHRGLFGRRGSVQ